MFIKCKLIKNQERLMLLDMVDRNTSGKLASPLQKQTELPITPCSSKRNFYLKTGQRAHHLLEARLPKLGN